MGSTSKTFPLSREMAANTPLMLKKPLRCHVPLQKSGVSTAVAELFVFDVLLRISMAASLIVCSATSLVNDAILLADVS